MNFILVCGLVFGFDLELNWSWIEDYGGGLKLNCVMKSKMPTDDV